MATVQKWGNSLGVRIPSNIAKNFKFTDGTKVEIKEVGGAIVIEPLRKKPTLDELLSRVTEENKHEAIEAPPVGKELI